MKPPPPPRPTSGKRPSGPVVYEDEKTRTNLEQRDQTVAIARNAGDAEAARAAGSDGDSWPNELAALSRNAKQLSERDATRGALLFGAVSVLAQTMSEFDAARAAL